MISRPPSDNPTPQKRESYSKKVDICILILLFSSIKCVSWPEFFLDGFSRFLVSERETVCNEDFIRSLLIVLDAHQESNICISRCLMSWSNSFRELTSKRSLVIKYFVQRKSSPSNPLPAHCQQPWCVGWMLKKISNKD